MAADTPSGSLSAGINRHEVEKERVLRERSSEPLGPEFCAGCREADGEAYTGVQAGWAIELRKRENRDADTLGMVEGRMSRDASASPGAVPRSRRTQSTAGNFMHENREASATPAEEQQRQDGRRRPTPRGPPQPCILDMHTT